MRTGIVLVVAQMGRDIQTVVKSASRPRVEWCVSAVLA